MNEKFFNLPEEKQKKIIASGYRIFARNAYRKSPVGEIAGEAGISKSLLFHYFHNKKELYLYLLKLGGDTTIDTLKRYGCFDEPDRFKGMLLAMQAKLDLMRTDPDLSLFMIRAYFEKDPEVMQDVQAYMKANEHIRSDRFFGREEKEVPEHLFMMYKTMRLAVEGFLFEKLFRSDLNPEKLEKEFTAMIYYWMKLFQDKGDQS